MLPLFIIIRWAGQWGQEKKKKRERRGRGSQGLSIQGDLVSRMVLYLISFLCKVP
jgi:hypothetical protein